MDGSHYPNLAAWARDIWQLPLPAGGLQVRVTAGRCAHLRLCVCLCGVCAGEGEGQHCPCHWFLRLQVHGAQFWTD